MMNATITKREMLTPELMIFGVKPDAGVPDFHPGQYVVLGLTGEAQRAAHLPGEREAQGTDKLIKRAYSIGSSPSQKDHLEFFIAVVPDGSLTPRLIVPAVGDRIHVGTKITGTFTLLDSKPTDDLIFVSTGTGLAPFISMIRTPGTIAAGRCVTVVHGVRHPKDFAYVPELQAYEQRFSGLFRYFQIASRADDSWNGLKGRVQSLFQNGTIKANPETSRVYLCGNPGMVEEMEATLATSGFTVHHAKKNPHGRVHLEKYW